MSASVAFDLDGTLVELPVNIEAAREEISAFFAARGFHEPMRPILDAINRGAAVVAGSDDEIFPIILRARAILDRYEVEAASRARPMPGATEALETLIERRVPLGIVTNNGRACVAPALAVLGRRIEEFVVSTRDDVRRPKPGPDGLVSVASRLGGPGDEMWFIGDSPVDISAAVAANSQCGQTLRAIAIPGPRSTLHQLRAAGPCVFFDSLAEALDRILKRS